MLTELLKLYIRRFCRKKVVLQLKQCILYDRDCIECGECSMCDLDPEKICDNCGKCIENESDYAEIEIENIEV